MKVNGRNIVHYFLILTLFNIEKYMKSLCQHVHVTLGQRLSNGQNYTIVCPNLTYL